MKRSQPQIKHFDASLLRVGIVTARFNQDITNKLLESALTMLQQNKVADNNIKVISVAGSAEIPYALQKLARTTEYDCLVALGCVIRGETPHFDYVCAMAQQGILRVSLDHHIPIGFGILTTNNLDQAETRIDLGGAAAFAAIELAKL